MESSALTPALAEQQAPSHASCWLIRIRNALDEIARFSGGRCDCDIALRGLAQKGFPQRGINADVTALRIDFIRANKAIASESTVVIFQSNPGAKIDFVEIVREGADN